MTFKSGFLFVLIGMMLLAGCRNAQHIQTTIGPTASPTASGAPAPAASATTNASSDGVKTKTDACALLTNADIEAIQKEAVRETKLTGSSQGGFAVSQCFFTLPTFNNSISLQITQRGDGSANRDPREFWRETFHPESKSEKEREREKKERGREEEEEEGAPPQKISGVGDEAFWVGSRIGGALYVLKGNSYLRVSIGGGGPQSDKIQRLKSLAQKVTERL